MLSIFIVQLSLEQRFCESSVGLHLSYLMNADSSALESGESMRQSPHQVGRLSFESRVRLETAIVYFRHRCLLPLLCQFCSPNKGRRLSSEYNGQKLRWLSVVINTADCCGISSWKWTYHAAVGTLPLGCCHIQLLVCAKVAQTTFQSRFQYAPWRCTHSWRRWRYVCRVDEQKNSGENCVSK